MLMQRRSLRGKCICIATVCLLVKTLSSWPQGFDNKQSSQLALSVHVRGCVHFKTLLCHVSARQEFQPPWALLQEPSRECRPPVNKHKGLAVKRGRPSSSRDVTLPRNSVQPLVTCLGFFSTSCSFLLWFFLSNIFLHQTVAKEIFSSPEISCF